MPDPIEDRLKSMSPSGEFVYLVAMNAAIADLVFPLFAKQEGMTVKEIREAYFERLAEYEKHFGSILRESPRPAPSSPAGPPS
jgi:hypothetical protein